MSLQLRFWGTRGSIPAPGPNTVRYGGNTPCVEVRTSTDALLILDAGTGMRELGRSLITRANGAAVGGEIYLSHAHWDHIQGLPFFAPMFANGNSFRILGPHGAGRTIERVIRDQMAGDVFPVTFDELRARIEFGALAEGPQSANGCELVAFGVNHPGGAVGYRLSETEGTGHSVVYISDNELGSGGDYGSDARWRARLLDFVGGARVLVHDAMYTADEYDRHRGWGHSTFDDAVRLALVACVAQLGHFHHKA